MMRVLWRLAALTLLLAAGLAILFLIFIFLPHRQRLTMKRTWSRLLLAICGIRLRGDTGPPTLPQGPVLVVMNHVSWLDIFVLNARIPSTFVAKAEIRRWPLVGWLVAGSGTVFIERGSRHAVRHVNHEIIRRMAQGEIVAFFPEGSTSEGHTMLPFHTSLFAMAIPEPESGRGAASVVPVALRYFQGDRPSTIPAYVGDQSLVDSIYKILSAQDLSVRVAILEPIDPASAPFTRHALADLARQRIGDALGA